MIPYARQWIEEDDIAAVTQVLRSDWLTTGPKVAEFEAKLAEVCGTRYAVAVSSGTAALHAMMYAINIRPGDEVIVPAMTFAATANAVVYQGGTPVFADVDPETLLIDPASVEAKLTDKTRAIVAVDYAGQPANYSGLESLALGRDAHLLADACHSIGATYHGRPTGSLAACSVFSFHAVKHVAMGEGGAVTTNTASFAAWARMFRNHGRCTDGGMLDLGYNYRLPDIQCALGISQLGKINTSLACREFVARQYDGAFRDLDGARPLRRENGRSHAYHLYVVQFDLEQFKVGTCEIAKRLRERGVGTQIHYRPVHLLRYYRERFGTQPGMCPVAEHASEQILSLPMYYGMTEKDVDLVIDSVREVVKECRR